MDIIRNIFRSNTTYLPYVQVATTIITLLVLMFHFSLAWSFVSLFVYTLIGLGISVGFHRYLAHKSFKLKYSFMEWPMLWLGCLAGTGSPLAWAAVHRKHHKYADKPDDPHSPANIGLKVFVAAYDDKWTPWSVREILVNPVHRFIHDYYFLLLLGWFLAACAISLNVALYGVIVPMAMIIWASTVSNYLNHKWGYVSHNTNDDSKNLWITALFTFGEGWHNNHHAKPRSYYFGQKWWEIDLGGLLIKGIKQ